MKWVESLTKDNVTDCSPESMLSITIGRLDYSCVRIIFTSKNLIGDNTKMRHDQVTLRTQIGSANYTGLLWFIVRTILQIIGESLESVVSNKYFHSNFMLTLLRSANVMQEVCKLT